MSIAVIGAGGQLGQDLCPLLDPDVLRITRKDVDVTDYTGLEKVLTECSPDIVINLSACNLVCLLYTSPSPRDRTRSRMPSSA